MRIRIHAVSGVLSLVLIASSMLASAGVEILHSPAGIIFVKRLILYSLALLIPALVVAGISGQSLVGKRRGRLMQTKRWRLLVSVAAALLILAPSAVTLYLLAVRGQLDGRFYAVQGLEFAAAGLNIALLSLNMRDGLRLSGRLRKRPHAQSPLSPSKVGESTR